MTREEYLRMKAEALKDVESGARAKAYEFEPEVIEGKPPHKMMEGMMEFEPEVVEGKTPRQKMDERLKVVRDGMPRHLWASK